MTNAPSPVTFGRAASPQPTIGAIVDSAMVRRAAVIALVLGSVLAFLNQWPAFMGREPFRTLPLVLVYLTPFAVVTISQILGIRRAIADRWRRKPYGRAGEGFLETAFAHGIPLKALLLGLLAGSVNSTIMVSAAFLEPGGLGTLPVAPMVQAFSLPVVFGALSQTIAYRRAPSRPLPRSPR